MRSGMERRKEEKRIWDWNAGNLIQNTGIPKSILSLQLCQIPAPDQDSSDHTMYKDVHRKQLRVFYLIFYYVDTSLALAIKVLVDYPSGRHFEFPQGPLVTRK